MDTDDTNAALRERLAAAVLGRGVAEAGVRRAAFTGEDDGLDEPYRTVIDLVRAASYRVTDTDVARLRDTAGGDRAAFEVIFAASAGAGVQRWDAAMRALAEGPDAAD